MPIAVSMLFAQTPDANAPRLLMYPTVHGDTVVFTFASDLWSANIHGGEAKRLTSGYGNKAFSQISPDGTTVAFSAAYDGAANVYTIPIEGGPPKRLTYNSTGDTVLGWTPDGKVAYRTAAYAPYLQRQQELFTISPQGGMPNPTPIHEIFWGSYFADGHEIAYTRRPSFLYNWRRYRGGTQGVVSLYDLTTNTYSELPHGREQQYYPMAVGDEIYYVSDKGDGVLNLYRYHRPSKNIKKLTNFTTEDIKWANTDGKSIVFTQDGYLWHYDIASGAYHTLSPTIHADELLSRPRIQPAGTMIHGLALSPTGTRLAIEARGQLFSVPAHSGSTRQVPRGATVRDQAPQWSPDGQSIAFVSDATGETEVYTMPQLGGPPTQITNLKKTIVGFAYSPDGNKFAVQTIDNMAYVVDVATKLATKIAQSLYGFGGSDWSPDSKWYAYIDGKVTQTAVLKLYSLVNKTTTDVTSGDYPDSDVAFDMNGKYLYLNSSRTFNPEPGLFGPDLKIDNAQRLYLVTLAKDTPDPRLPTNDEEPTKEPATSTPAGAPGQPPKPGGPPPAGPGTPGGPQGRPVPSVPPPGARPDMKVDLDGLGKRLIPLPMPPGTYANLVGANNGVYFASPLGLMKFDVGTKSMTPVISGPIMGVSFNAARTMIAYYGLGVVGVAPAGGGATFGAGRVDTSNVEFMLNPRDEWTQIFWEAWRFIRDHYYDENFRGMNWKAIGDHYATYLPSCASRYDVNTIITLMLSELGTGHSYLEAPGDLGPTPRPMPVGALGADYAVVGHAVKFAKIYRGDTESEADTAPLGIPGIDIKDGDFLISIDGVAISDTVSPASQLVDKAGKLVTLVVNSTPSATGARTVRVRPGISEIQLRYVDFLERSKALVEKLSHGRIGYMHIRDTASTGSEDFARSFNALTDKDALIVDERWNGGGYPDPKFVEALATKTYAYGQSRSGGDQPIEASPMGPMAMLINSYAGSGGDLFPWTFKKAGLGVLIGTRTWGGLIGIGPGADLVDGGSISTPSFSIYDEHNEIIAENHGVDPDIEVDMRPDLAAKGEDPQLEAAIKYLMDKLAKMPVRKPREALPHVNKDAKVNP
ncbi:MAG TPA: S41 family peptidase [Fimbriimonadaceae bacterium]|nr:S41 family peptidase [Fimbriimonadaceae bacterium]